MSRLTRSKYLPESARGEQLSSAASLARGQTILAAPAAAAKPLLKVLVYTAKLGAFVRPERILGTTREVQ